MLPPREFHDLFVSPMYVKSHDRHLTLIAHQVFNILNREFLDLLEETLHTIHLSNKKCLIMGDVNINTLKKSNIAKQYLNLVRSEGFNPLISEATRITETSQTCLDHIHINLSLPSTSGSIAIEIVDHLPVFSILYRIDQTPFPDTIEFRDFKRLNIDLFKAELNEIDWSPVYRSSDVNESLSRFLHIFNRVSNKHAPIKSVKVSNNRSKPWITLGLKKSMRVRDELYKQWLSTRNLNFLSKYKKYCNKITYINKLYRTSYYNDVLAHSSNSKKMWDNINLIVNKRRPSSNIEKLQHDGKQYHQPFSISYVLNKYFCDVPFYLASKLPKSNCHFTSYLQQKKCSFCLETVNEFEVFLLLENLDGKKSFGVDTLHLIWPLLLHLRFFVL